jgi:hypothetical protein
MCWYDPPEKSKKVIKGLCLLIVDEIKMLEKNGDPIGCEIDDVKRLLDHLYEGKCDEKPQHN